MPLSQIFISQLEKSANMLQRGFMPGLVCLVSLLVWADTGEAQISISGVTDKGVYADKVSFIVSSEAGYDYTVELNGVSVATDVSIEVDEPEYYELYVYRREQSSGAEESELVRFIVRASERGNTEWGLPMWTPYPLTASAAAEFTGAQLKIVAPAQYPLGLEIPVVARVEDGSGKRLGVNGDVGAVGFEDYPLQLLRGVGSVFLPAATEAGAISYTAQIQTLQTPRQITIEASTTWQTISVDISTSTDWGEDARIHISGVTGDVLTIASGATLTIGAGSVIKIDPDIEVAVEGNIIVNGTAERPVVFTCPDRNVPWGGFLFESGSAQGDFTGAIFTASGADANWFNNNPGHGSAHRQEQCLFYLSNGANVTLTDCYLVENQGQAGHGESSYLTMTGCLVQKFVTCGQYNGGEVTFEDCALIEFPLAGEAFADADNDVIYLTDGVHSFTDCLLGWSLDDAIDAGGSTTGSITVNNCWFESIYHEGMAWSGYKVVSLNDTVILNCGQGIECGYDGPNIDADHCLSTANVTGARFGDNYDWSYSGFLKVSNSLLLYNVRDVWGRAWDDWTVHLANMDIQSNYLSVPNANFPNNLLWNPQSDPNHLDELELFLPSPATTVGIGFATPENTYNLSEVSNKIPVRLSTFTTNSVAVDYSVYTEDGLYDSGALHFIPGESLKHIQFDLPPLEGLEELRITLSNPVNAELTGYQQIIYAIPHEIVVPLILEGDEWHYFKGNYEPPGDWNELSFNIDSNWLLGPTSIGYETGTGYESCLATNLTDMRNNYISVYARRLFNIDNPSRLISLTFTMDFDDGYIAYLNGFPVDDRYPPDPPAYDQPASTSNHEACCGTGTPSGPCPPEQIDLTNHIGILATGNNVLAVQVHNTSLGSSDFIFIPELFAVITPLPGDFEPDGDVDFDDYAVLALAWLAEDGQENYHPAWDISIPPDGSINMLDLMVFVDNWLAGL